MPKDETNEVVLKVEEIYKNYKGKEGRDWKIKARFSVTVLLLAL